MERRSKRARIAVATVGEEIARGGFGVVHACTMWNGVRGVRKSLHRDTHTARLGFEREYRVLYELRGVPQAVRVLDCIRDADGRLREIYLEHGGEAMYDVVANGISMERAERLTRRACVALKALHDVSLVHRDVKLENMVVGKDDHIKFIDFGLSSFRPDGTLCVSLCGSHKYRAPEIDGFPYHGDLADAWSMGVCAYAIHFGNFLFDTANKEDWRFRCFAMHQRRQDSAEGSVKHMQATFYPETCFPGPSGKMSQVMESLMTVDPSRRTRVRDLVWDDE